MKIPTKAAYKLYHRKLQRSKALVSSHYDDAALSVKDMSFNKRIKSRGFKLRQSVMKNEQSKLDYLDAKRGVKKFKLHVKKGYK